MKKIKFIKYLTLFFLTNSFIISSYAIPKQTKKKQTLVLKPAIKPIVLKPAAKAIVLKPQTIPSKITDKVVVERDEINKIEKEKLEQERIKKESDYKEAEKKAADELAQQTERDRLTREIADKAEKDRFKKVIADVVKYKDEVKDALDIAKTQADKIEDFKTKAINAKEQTITKAGEVETHKNAALDNASQAQAEATKAADVMKDIISIQSNLPTVLNLTRPYAPLTRHIKIYKTQLDSAIDTAKASYDHAVDAANTIDDKATDYKTKANDAVKTAKNDYDQTQTIQTRLSGDFPSILTQVEEAENQMFENFKKASDATNIANEAAKNAPEKLERERIEREINEATVRAKSQCNLGNLPSASFDLKDPNQFEKNTCSMEELVVCQHKLAKKSNDYKGTTSSIRCRTQGNTCQPRCMVDWRPYTLSSDRF